MSAVAAEILSRRCPALTHLYCINQCNNRRFESNDVFKQLSGIKALQVLQLHGCHKITAEGYAHLKKLLALRRLELSECVCLDAALGHLKDIPMLDTLVFYGCEDLSATGFAHLKECKSLTRLDFDECDDITDDDLAALSELTLTCLALQNQNDLTGAGFVHLRGLPLQHLLLSYCPKLSSQCLAHIGCLTELRSLKLCVSGPRRHLGGTEGCICADVESAQSLAGLTKLEYLNVWASGLTNEGLDRLHTLTSLKSIHLDYNLSISEGAVERLLDSCQQLKTVGLKSPGISDAFIENLAARGIQVHYWEGGYPQ